MSEPAVIVKNLSKSYKIYPSARARFLELISPFKKEYHQKFAALKDISFEIPKGQTLGVVGRNGSGKSTLLQLITGVLSPSSGSIHYNGRISALLELGAGFNPEFSGRENVIIQGAIQGFSQEQMIALLPEIEAFADLGEFIQRPVKTYSSGMYIRLAFAAAIHVDPDILIVDEALAVGDAKFQAKCFRKFKQFRKEGKTILLVTHDANAVVKYCDHAILLEAGGILEAGTPKAVINRYLELLTSKTPEEMEEGLAGDEEISLLPKDGSNSTDLSSEVLLPELQNFRDNSSFEDQCSQRSSYNPHEHKFGDQTAKIIDYFIVSKNQESQKQTPDPSSIYSHEDLKIYVKVKFERNTAFPIYGMTLKTTDGIEVYGNNSMYEELKVTPQKAGSIAMVEFCFRMRVVAGDYFISLGVAKKAENGEIVPLDRRYDLIHLSVLQVRDCVGFVDLQASIQEWN